jgi:tripartite-type tricarboxylate transporter receptor subunit TctC
MVVPADSGIRSLKDLAALAKANPGKTNFGSAGVGSSGHIAGELFNLIAGVKMVHVPYRGSGPALVGLMGGEIQVMFENLPSALTLVRGGKLRGIAVLSTKRSPSAPEIPTTTEMGMPDLTIASSTGLLVSASTPRPVVEKLEAALQDIAKDPEAGRTLAKFGADVDYMTAAQYQSYLDSEIARWAEVGKRAGVSVK